MKQQPPSLLELYIEILQSLEKLQTCSLRTIQEETNVEKTALAKAIAFLEKNDLVRNKTVQNQTIYSITLRGERVSRYFLGHEQKEKEINYA